MDAPLQSGHWHRVAGLRPRWRLHARSARHAVRGEVWHVVSGDARAETLRLDAASWSIAGRCDGRATVQAIWDAAWAGDPQRAPTQDETISILLRLVECGAIECDGVPDLAARLAGERRDAARRRRARLNPIAPRIPLGDPSRWLRPLAPLGARLFSPLGAWAWVALVLAACAVAFAEADAVRRHAARWLDAPRYLLLALVAWPPMKLLHEAAHALAVRRWGGEVREAGVALVLGLPVPYVDATDANRFPRASARAAVAAAGVLAELATAAAGLLLWAVTGPGWLHDAGFAVAVAGSASTLLFNGNPLLRMDAYFVLCDLAGLPNLATRSAAWWRAALARAAAGLDRVRAPAAAPGETPWLVAYAPLAWAWRATMVVALALWAGGRLAPLGVAIAVAGTAWLVGLPVLRLLRAPSHAAPTPAARAVARLRLGATLAAVLAVVALVPLPDRSVVPALVAMPEAAEVRAGVDGFVAEVSVDAPDGVASGTVLMRLDDPALEIDRRRAENARQGALARLFASLRSDPALAREAEQEFARAQAELARIDERIALQRVRAGSGGRIEWIRPQDMPGRWVREGEVVGHLGDAARPVLRVALGQDEAAQVRQGVRAVQVRLAEAPGHAWTGRLLREAPAAVDALPGAALGDRAGGPVPVDPRDADGLRPARPIWVVDVALDDAGGPAPRPGGRAWVRLDFGAASLGAQGWRWVRQTVRGRFAPDEV